jgi:hypothetical protein
MDYILFIHGVNTRERRELRSYADPLCKQIQDLVEAHNRSGRQKIDLKMIPLYWGTANQEQENQLLKTYQQSKHWHEMGFRDFREKQLLQFTGDAALYISRYAGTRVVDALLKGALDPQDGIEPNFSNQDRLHLVTHSWGTVIFFDLLFSGRWDSKEVGSYQKVSQIREVIFGLDPNPQKGLRLSSIHTMGSPISIFSLFMSSGKEQHPAILANGHNRIPNTHDITPGLLKWLRHIQYEIPWYNYIHPDDIIAYPLQELVPEMLATPGFALNKKLNVRDLITAPPTRLQNILVNLSGPLQKFQVGFRLGAAHGSYWTNPTVAERIVSTIQKTMPAPKNSRNSMSLDSIARKVRRPSSFFKIDEKQRDQQRRVQASYERTVPIQDQLR